MLLGASFQHFMNDIFHNLLDMCIVVYLNNILIYSDDVETHWMQGKKMLERLCVIVMPIFRHRTLLWSSEYLFRARVVLGLQFVSHYRIMDQYFVQGTFIRHRLLSRVCRN
jgi:hypothetical protein